MASRAAPREEASFLTRVVEPALFATALTGIMYLAGRADSQAYYGAFGVPISQVPLQTTDFLHQGFWSLGMVAIAAGVPLLLARMAGRPETRALTENVVLAAGLLLMLCDMALAEGWWAKDGLPLPLSVEGWMLALSGVGFAVAVWRWRKSGVSLTQALKARLGRDGHPVGALVLLVFLALTSTALASILGAGQGAALAAAGRCPGLSIELEMGDASHPLDGRPLCFISRSDRHFLVLDVREAGRPLHFVPMDDVRLARIL